MDIQGLQAQRAQLLYEFGEIEYERRLFIQRLTQLDTEYDTKLKEIQEVENEINSIDEGLEKFSKLEIFKEKNSENILKSE